MNRYLKGFLALVACAALITGCATVPDTVATVNGTTISGEEYQRTLNGFLANYGLTEESMKESLDNAQVVEYKNNVIDELVLQELMLQYASEQGLDALTDEDIDTANNEVTTYLADLKKSFESDVELEGELEGDQAASEAQKRYDDYVATYGYSEENLLSQFKREMILDRVYDNVMEGTDVTDEDVRDYYDTRVAAAEQKDKEDPDAALSEYLTDAVTDATVYIPSKAQTDTRYVKHILIELPSDVSAEISDLRSSGDDEGADKLQEQAMADLKEEAEQIRQKALAGEDFEALIEQYNQDPGMEYTPEGYLVYEGASFDEGFLQGALALENVGDISSEPVESSYGYHIIKYVSAPTSGPVDYDEVKNVLADSLQQQTKEQRWKDTVAAWKEDAQIEKHQFRTEGSGSSLSAQ